MFFIKKNKTPDDADSLPTPTKKNKRRETVSGSHFSQKAKK